MNETGEGSLKVPGYVVESRVGQGGAANVYRAVCQADGATVALKMVRPEVAKLLGTERFLREIKIAGSIAHPHLVPLLDWGEVAGLPYYIMPFLPGGSLRDRLDREGQLPLPTAVLIAIALARALGALHAHGIVHRDVKPENILVGPDGTDVLLADYGIARALSVASLEPITSTGIVIGTPAYMSPEQGAGDTVDARTDIYALGCVLYEMLAGEPPFTGPTAQVIIGRHIGETLPSLGIARPGIPAPLEALVQRTLAKAAADRPQSAQELVEALTEVDLAAPPGPVPGRAPRRTLRLLGLGLGAFGLAAALWLVWPRPGALDPRRVVVFPFTAADPEDRADGEQLALLIGSALERTEPMRWLDGWAMLGRQEQEGRGSLTAAAAEGLARRAGARYFLDGSLWRVGDSVRVLVRLHDLVEQGAPVTRTAVGTSTDALVDLALQAILELLPRIVGVGPFTNVVRLRDRNPAAVARWLQGEREYRSSRMAGALALFEAALADDSLLAPAALRGALAASWLNSGRAGPLNDLALRHAEQLSTREHRLAAALREHLTGHANAAIEALRLALTADSSSADVWLLAGEVYLDLLPTIGLDPRTLTAVPAPRTWPLERMAMDAFAQAVQLDSTFTPPVVNLAEIALRAGNRDDARRWIEVLRRSGSEPATVSRLELAARCLGDDGREDWRAQARRDGLQSYHTGALLIASLDSATRNCGRRVLEAVLAADTATAAEDWGALLLVQSALIGAGQSSVALAMVDSAVAGGMTPALGLFVLDAVAGVEVGGRAAQFVAELGTGYAVRSAASLWLLTVWHASRQEWAPIHEVAAVLARRIGADGSRVDSLVGSIASAYSALGRGDSATAMARLEVLVPAVPSQVLEGSLWEPLATERIVLAELLLARGEYAKAHRVASVFDHPGVFIHQLFLAQSLRLRVAAATALGEPTLAAAASRRLDQMLIRFPPSGR
ncbi:MAG: serine/threonine-protein kinase [Gemmatimonadota bacterium]|nr:serine/threonine-protein kinase [Gemmatimonadota bacterium]